MSHLNVKDTNKIIRSFEQLYHDSSAGKPLAPLALALTTTSTASGTSGTQATKQYIKQ
jgi:hypothetical protein